MNKRQLEVQKISAADEQRIIRQLKQVYSQASKDCAAKIQELSMRTDLENIQSIVYQKQYQEAIKKQIDGILNDLNSKSFASIADYLGQCYETGFIGTMYDIQGQGIPLCFPINQEDVVQALQVDSKIAQGLYQRMGEDTNHLKKSIKAELSRGISNGSSWNMVAGKIASGMNSSFDKAYKRAVVIARTEGHRVQQQSTLHCQQRAKSKGADVLKQWDSTLDGVTRPTHRELDGQIREIDEPFEVAGMKAMYPGAFGNPAEDCNCRCCLLQRARWALGQEELDTLKERAEFFGLDKTKDFEDYKQKYLKLPVKADTMDISIKTVADCKDFSELQKYMKDMYNVPVDNSVSKLDFEAVHQSVQGIEQVMNEFPQAKSTLKNISTAKSGVMAASYDGTISFNPGYYTNISNLSGMIQGNATGFHPKNNDLLTTGSHEMGHLLERTMIEKSINDGKYVFGGIEWGKCTEAKKIVSEASKNAKKSPDGKDPLTGKGYKNFELTSQVSRYAMQNSSECLAECVADYIANGEDAAILSKEVWKILKRELG